MRTAIIEPALGRKRRRHEPRSIQAIEIVEAAEDVELEMARTANGSLPPQSIVSLLAPIAKSLRTNHGE